MNIITEIRNNLEWKRIKNEMAQRSAEERQLYEEMPFMSPYLVTLKKWLNGEHGDTSRLKWLTEEVIKYQDSNHQLDGHIYILYEEDEFLLALDDEAVRILTDDVLQGFFGKEECFREYKELHHLNVLPRMYRIIYKSFFTMQMQKLDELEKTWQEYSATPEAAAEPKAAAEYRQNVMYMIQKVRKQRKML